MEGRTWVVDQRLFGDVCEALKRAGFQAQSSGSGVRAELVPEGVVVGWNPDLAVLRPAIGFGQLRAAAPRGIAHGQGIKAAMFIALNAVLEQAGYQVAAVDTGLLVTGGDQLSGTTSAG